MPLNSWNVRLTLSCWFDMAIYRHLEILINPFAPNAPFLYPLKTSENRFFRKNFVLFKKIGPLSFLYKYYMEVSDQSDWIKTFPVIWVVIP